MSRPKLSLCMIVRDEEENLAICLDSVRAHVDELIIVDTGSEDRTRDVAVAYGASVHQFDPNNHPEAFFRDTAEENAKWGAPGAYSGMWCLADFGAARAESFKHATGDYLAWIDADDVLIGGENLRRVVDELERTKQPFGYLAYDYQKDDQGRVHYRQWRERVIRRGSGYWTNPVHEVIMPTAPPTDMPKFDSPVYSHRRKADRKMVPHRNYKILLRQAWQLKSANPTAPLDPRILFYLGKEGMWPDPKRAVGFFEEYLSLSGWPEERAAAHSSIATMLEFGAFEMPPAALLAQMEREFAVQAIEMPENPDGLFGLARVAHMRERWHDCVRYSEWAFKLGNTDSMLGANPMDRLYRPHVYYNFALSKLNRVEDALKSCRAALAVCPDDPGIHGGASGMLTLNAAAYEKFLQEQKERAMQGTKPKRKFDDADAVLRSDDDIEAPPHPSIKDDALVIWAMQLWKKIIARGDHARARDFLASLPHEIASHPVSLNMGASTRRRWEISAGFRPQELSSGPEHRHVVFFLGAGPEPWDPTTPETKGLGGSETAAIEVARHLARLGCKVEVFAEARGNFDGVEYRHHSEFRAPKCDIFIASRAPYAIEAFGQIDAKVRLLWVHDIGFGPRSAPLERQLYQFDRMLALSAWHKDFLLKCYPTVHPERILVTRNGIEPKRFIPMFDGAPQTGMPQKTNSLVFSSSPNRGLQYLIPNFLHRIRPAVPDAELHVFYGFDTWETFARASNNHAELASIEQFKMMLPAIGTSRDGIFNHGKRPQQEVAAAYMRSKVWPYLTDFTETSCITAMEAMAAGAVPVCSALAALPETVGQYGIVMPNLGTESAPRFDADEWCSHVIRLMLTDEHREKLARAAREHALRDLSWEGVAKEWFALFDVLAREVAANPSPLWRAA